MLKPGLDTVPSARYFAKSVIVSTVLSVSNSAVLIASPNVSTTASSSIFAASLTNVLIVEVGNSFATCSSIKSTQASAAPSSNLSVIALVFLAISAISAFMLKPGLVNVPSARYLARSVIVLTVSSDRSFVTLNIAPEEPITASSSRSFASSVNVLIVDVGKRTQTCSSTQSTYAPAAPSSNLTATALVFLAISAIAASLLIPGLLTVPSAMY